MAPHRARQAARPAPHVACRVGYHAERYLGGHQEGGAPLLGTCRPAQPCFAAAYARTPRCRWAASCCTQRCRSPGGSSETW